MSGEERERDHMISFGVAATTEAIAAKLSGGERHQGKIGLQHGHSFHIRFLLLLFADSCSHIIYVGAKQRYEPTPSRIQKRYDCGTWEGRSVWTTDPAMFVLVTQAAGTRLSRVATVAIFLLYGFKFGAQSPEACGNL